MEVLNTNRLNPQLRTILEGFVHVWHFNRLNKYPQGFDRGSGDAGDCNNSNVVSIF